MELIAIVRQTPAGAQSTPDRAGVEAALRLKQAAGGTVTAVCCGTRSALPLLREALSMGCDGALLIEEPDEPGRSRPLDPTVCASALAAVLKSFTVDAVIAGCYAVDADAIQIGFLLAAKLGLLSAGYAEEISPAVTDGGQGAFLVKRQFEDRTQLLELPSPCLISALPQPGRRIYPTAEGITRAYSADIPILPIGEPAAAPVRLLRSYEKKARKRGTVLTCPTEEAVSAIMDTMIRNHIL